MLKKRATGEDPSFKMSPGAYLLCSAQASSQSPPLFLLTPSYTTILRRCDRGDDQSNMDCKSKDVHDPSGLADRV